jgi:coenzyme F420 hydrogenase subunit beta
VGIARAVSDKHDGAGEDALAHSVDDIVKSGLCIGCGLCASLSKGRIAMRWTGPGRLRPVVEAPLDRAALDLVNDICPGLRTDGMTAAEAGPGAVLDPAFGYGHRHWIGWAGDPEVRFRAATGGVLTALGIHLLESKAVDAVLHVRSPTEAPVRNVPHVSRSRADVLAGMGSRYAPAAPLLHLDEHLARGESLAVIAKPCDVAAVRRLAKRDPRVGRQVKYLLSISCGGAPTLDMTRRLMAPFPVEERDLALFRFRGHGCPGRVRMETRDGRAYERSYNDSWGDKDLWHLQFRCKMCMDPVGEQADVIAYDVWPGGSPTGEDAGFNGITARTAKGLALVEAAAKAGALVLDRQVGPGILPDTQPHQTWKKMGILGRQIGLRLAGRIAPRFPGLRVVRMAFAGGIPHTIKNALGVMRRARRGGVAEPAAI